MRDLISRQAVIDMVKGWKLNQHIMNEEDALDDVNELLSAQPDNTCNGCRYERFGNRACYHCSRVYMDRYEVKQDG